MKTVIIPNDYHPFVIEVNGVKYTYPEGTEQSVPDEVASAIENYYKLQPQERPTDGGVLPYVSGENNGEVLTVKDGAWQNREAAKELPAVTSANNGKVLKVSSGKWAIGTDNGTSVTANPTLAGTEAALTGLQVGSTKYKVEAGGVENGYVLIDITSGSAGTINSVKFNDVEKGANWLKDSQTAVILSISQVVIKINNDQYSIDANWVNFDTYLSGTGTYALNTPDGDEFGLCEISFVFADDEINADFIQLLST